MNIVLFGASGMVGIEVLHHALADNSVNKIVSITRSPLEIDSPKLEQIVHKDFTSYTTLANVFKEADVCIYCLGVYQTHVNKEKFWEITVSYLGHLVKAIEAVNPNLTFCLFSAQGASQQEKSLFRFGNAKGRAERLLVESGINKKYIFRPGFISPGRKAAFGGISLKIYQLIYRLFPSSGISAEALAQVMLQTGLTGGNKLVHENSDIRLLADNNQ